MPHFKAPDGTLHFLDDESDLDILPVGSVKISDMEASNLRLPSESEQMLLQISQLESTVTPRRIREALLGTDGGWLKNVETQIQVIREKLPKS